MCFFSNDLVTLGNMFEENCIQPSQVLRTVRSSTRPSPKQRTAKTARSSVWNPVDFNQCKIENIACFHEKHHWEIETLFPLHISKYVLNSLFDSFEFPPLYFSLVVWGPRYVRTEASLRCRRSMSAGCHVGRTGKSPAGPYLSRRHRLSAVKVHVGG